MVKMSLVGKGCWPIPGSLHRVSGFDHQGLTPGLWASDLYRRDTQCEAVERSDAIYLVNSLHAGETIVPLSGSAGSDGWRPRGEVAPARPRVVGDASWSLDIRDSRIVSEVVTRMQKAGNGEKWCPVAMFRPTEATLR